MSDHRRGRRHSRYDQGYPYYDYDYERPPRHRSLGRQALDKLGDAMGSLALDDNRTHDRGHRSITRYRSPEGYDRHPRDHYHHGHHHARRRHHSSSPTRHSRRSRRGGTASSSSTARPASSRSRSRLDRGLKAAVDAAAIEAIRLRNEPGRWSGAKGGRVATAAISAGVIGTAAEKRKQDTGKGTVGTLGSAVGGLVVNRLLNGPRDQLR
ncbi:hypothetical protein N656DRAFT_779428 [Canariomyces notabilis]|uniref:Uncharacterized protein n=1 Tax=Canariomyces notabilis TaxID=2074819 RepID=A0AAN6YS51_9PEZI|nr:hypothetical protein N656DRAFT_779428 [Canariomyces arenarius]